MSLLSATKGISTIKTSRQVISNAPVQQKCLTPTGQVANGANLKEVKGRIKSVTSIRKITKTMNMIATARLKHTQNRMYRARTFYGTVSKLFESLPPPVPAEVKKSLIVPVGADRGLCGAINSSIAKNVRALIKEKEEKGQSVNVTSVGEKVPGQLAREYGTKLLFTFTEISKKPFSFLAACLIGERVLATEFDLGTYVFNKFNSVISYSTTTQEFGSLSSYVNRGTPIWDDYSFEEDATIQHVPDVIEYITSVALFRAYLEGSAAELGGRMTSMDNATRNAGEMIKKLTVMYNRRRQAAITTELTEIISGASAVQS